METPSSLNWPLLLLFALGLAGGVYALDYAFRSQSNLSRQLAEQNKQLAEEVRGLNSRLEAASSTSNTDGLKAELAQNAQTISALEARLASVEQTASAPAPVVQVKAGNSETLRLFATLKQKLTHGKPFAPEFKSLENISAVEPLKPYAETGVAKEEALRTQLKDFLDAHPAPGPIADEKLDKINAHMDGLLRITRKNDTVDPYATLRAQANNASLDVLTTSAAQLPADAMGGLAEWLKAAQARQSALAALAAAETSLAAAP